MRPSCPHCVPSASCEVHRGFARRCAVASDGHDMMRRVTTNPVGETPDVGIPRRLAASMTIGEQQEWLRRYLDRHRVTRRTALRGGAGVLAALGATTAPWALAGVRHRREHAGRRRSGGTCRSAPTRPGKWPSPPSSPASPTGRVVLESAPTPATARPSRPRSASWSAWSRSRTAASARPTSSSSTRSPTGSRRARTFHYRFRLADGTDDARTRCSRPRPTARPSGRSRSPRSPTRASTSTRRPTGRPASATTTTSPTTPDAPQRRRTRWSR